MGLWIRSQDMERLIHVKEELFYHEKNTMHFILTYSKETYRILGIYKAKERALEILDEIENILNFEDNHIIINHQLNRIKEYRKKTEDDRRIYVYRMPQE